MLIKFTRAAWRAAALECRRLMRPKDLPSPLPGTVAILRPDLLGDFVLASGFLPCFRTLYPGRSIALVANASWAKLASWLDSHQIITPAPLYDVLLPVQPERLHRSGVYARTLQALAPWQTLIYFTSSRTLAIDRLLGDTPGDAIACQGDSANQPALLNRWARRRYDTLLPGCGEGKELDRNAAFINALAGSVDVQPTPPRWQIPADLASRTVTDLANRITWPYPDRPYICLSPFASNRLKEWPAPYWQALVDALRQFRPNLKLVLLGAPGDQQRNAPTGCINLIGHTSLPELACVLAGACLSISGDTAAAHLASAVGTSVVAMVGGGHRDRFFPYPAGHPDRVNRAIRLDMTCDDCHWSCRYRPTGRRPAPCLSRITVDTVLQEALALLPE